MAHSHNFFYELDGYRMQYIPAIGGYSGYNPKRRRSDVASLSGNASLDWGTVIEETFLTLTAPMCSRAEYLSLQERYEDEDEYGNPKPYRFHAPDGDFTVEFVDLNGTVLHEYVSNVSLALKVLSEGSTRLYLCDDFANLTSAPTSSASSDEDQGHGETNRTICRKLRRQRNIIFNFAILSAYCENHPAETSDLLGIWISEQLRKQTLKAGERFRFAGRMNGAYYGGPNEGENVYLQVFPYLWRSGEGKVVRLFDSPDGTTGYIDPTAIIEYPWRPTWQMFELSALAADIDIQYGDRIVCEVWGYRADETTTYMGFFFDGEKDDWIEGDQTSGAGPTENYLGSASYLEYSGMLVFDE